jgi:hypothetical protein
MDLRMKRMFDIIFYIYRKCIEIVFTFKKLFLILINQNNINTINKINSYKNIFQPTKKSKREGLSTIQIPNSSF